MMKRIALYVLSLCLVGVIILTYAHNNPLYIYKYPLKTKSIASPIEDFQKKEALYLANLKRNPGGFQDLLAIAKIYFEFSKNGGRKYYLLMSQNYAYRAINARPSSIEAQYLMAEMALFLNQIQKAVLIGHKILKEKPKSPEAFLILTKSHIALFDLVEANRYADELVNVMPTQSSFVLRASILADLGRVEEAIFDFEEALRVELDDPVLASYSRAMFARLYINYSSAQKGRLEYAAELLKEALRINPSSPLALGLMGEMAEKNDNNYKKAINYYKAAFKESKDITYLLHEARAYKLMGNKDFSISLFKQAELILRNDLQKTRTSQLLLARLLIERANVKDYPEALKIAQMERRKNHPESLILLSRALELNNRLIDARRVIREVMALNFTPDEVYKRAISIEEKMSNSKLTKLYNNLLINNI